MAKVIRITDVPDDVHTALSAQAQDAGRSLGDRLREPLGQIAAGPAAAVAAAAWPAGLRTVPRRPPTWIARLRGTLVDSKR